MITYAASMGWPENTPLPSALSCTTDFCGNIPPALHWTASSEKISKIFSLGSHYPLQCLAETCLAILNRSVLPKYVLRWYRRCSGGLCMRGRPPRALDTFGRICTLTASNALKHALTGVRTCSSATLPDHYSKFVKHKSRSAALSPQSSTLEVLCSRWIFCASEGTEKRTQKKMFQQKLSKPG